MIDPLFALQRLRAPVLAVLVAAGCATDTSSPNGIDVASLSSGVSGMTAAFLNSNALQNVNNLALYFPQYLHPAAATSRGVRAWERALATLPKAAVGSLPSASASVARIMSGAAGIQALFPAIVQGRTLVWDTVGHQYQIDSTLTGAPPSGIRILIYAASPINGQPTLPLQQTGYLDLSDKSSGAASTLGVLLTAGPLAVAQYDVTLTVYAIPNDTAEAVLSSGFFNDAGGAGKIDFAFGDTASSGQLIIAGTLTGPDGTMIGSSVTVGNSSVAFAVAVSKGGNTITLNAVEGDITYTLAGEVLFNGIHVATISGTTDSPVFTAASGHKLSSNESDGLIEIFGGALLVVTALTNFVLAPATVVFS